MRIPEHPSWGLIVKYTTAMPCKKPLTMKHAYPYLIPTTTALIDFYLLCGQWDHYFEYKYKYVHIHFHCCINWNFHILLPQLWIHAIKSESNAMLLQSWHTVVRTCCPNFPGKLFVDNALQPQACRHSSLDNRPGGHKPWLLKICEFLQIDSTWAAVTFWLGGFGLSTNRHELPDVHPPLSCQARSWGCQDFTAGQLTSQLLSSRRTHTKRTDALKRNSRSGSRYWLWNCSKRRNATWSRSGWIQCCSAVFWKFTTATCSVPIWKQSAQQQTRCSPGAKLASQPDSWL